MAKGRTDSPEPTAAKHGEGIERKLDDCLSQSAYHLKTLGVLRKTFDPVLEHVPIGVEVVERRDLSDSSILAKLEILHAELVTSTAYANSIINASQVGG